MKTFKSFIVEGRPSQQHALEGHDYHKKTDDELRYIMKDAGEAAKAMRGHNEKAENKYMDQVNDASTVLHFRKTHGMPDWYKKKYEHIKEEVEQIDELSVKKYSEVYKAASKKDGQKHIDAQRRAYMAVKRKAKETSERMYESSDKGLAAAIKRLNKEGVAEGSDSRTTPGTPEYKLVQAIKAAVKSGKNRIANQHRRELNRLMSLSREQGLAEGSSTQVKHTAQYSQKHWTWNVVRWEKADPRDAWQGKVVDSYKNQKQAKAKARQLSKQGLAEGFGDARYKIKVIGTDKNGDYYISPNTGKKVYKKVKVGAHETPSGEIKNEEVKQIDEMDKSQTPPGRDGGHQFGPGPKVSKKDIEAVKKNPSKHLQDLFAKEYTKKKVKEEVEQIEEVAAWQRKEGKNPEGGLNRKGIESYRREHPGSKLSLAVTTKPSKLKKGSKAAKRRKSFCARMSGMKRRLTSAKTANDPNSRINKSLRKWNC